ncbi:MAG TPA: hypothetical protein DEH78_01475 [Solibacterales bacterium]|nr:hypothetical protein [Bryobacterales bacterium]
MRKNSIHGIDVLGLALAAFGAMLGTSQAARGQGPSASLAGVVVDSQSGSPVDGAQVTAWSASEGRLIQRSAVSLKGGTFKIENLEPGRYELAVEHREYPIPGSTSAPHRRRRVVSVPEGGDIKGITVPISKGGTLSGRVLDEERRPVEGMRVRVLTSLPGRGAKRLIAAGFSGETDPAGRFRFVNLAEDDYYILITPPVSGKRAGYLPSYYPGVDDAGQALPVSLESGRDFAVPDFVLVPAVSAMIAGAVQGEALTDAEPVAVTMYRTDRNPGELAYRGTTMAAKNGSFHFKGVFPGRYRVVAISERPGSTLLTAAAEVLVKNDSIEGLTLTLAPAGDIAGRVILKGTDAEPSEFWQEVQISCVGYDSVWPLNRSFTANLDRTGAFRIRSVPAANYLLYPSKLPPGAYVDSVKQGGSDVEDGRISVWEADTSVEILLTVGAGRIAGVVRARVGDPVPHASVLIEDGRDRRTAIVTDQNGSFDLKNLPPARYRIWAFETGVKPEAESRQKPLEVDLKASTSQTVDVRLR